MTDRHDDDQGGIATLEPAASGEAAADGLTQTPLEPNGAAAPPTRRGAPDRKAARELKRAERAERRPDRKERKLNAAIAPTAEPGEPPAVEPVMAGAASGVEPLPQEAMPEPEIAEPDVSDAEPAVVVELAAAVEDDLSSDDSGASPEPAAAANGRERSAKRADRLERKAARRGDGQDGAEPAPSREERRADRAERRAARPGKTAVAAPNGAVAPASNPDGAADVVADEGEAPRPPMLVKADLGDVPGLDGKAKRADRKAGRMDVQHAAAAEALSAIDPNNAAIAPLIRYVNAVSMHLNESQKTIGKLQIERDALRAQVVSLDAEPIDASRFAEIAKPVDASDAADLKQQRRSERQAAKAAMGEDSEGDGDEDAAKPMDDTGRKRRLIALGALALVGLVALATRVMNHPIDLSNMSKGSLGGLAVVGQFMQVFLAGMIFYRLARIGGRAGRWLFPENDPKMVKKHQQEAKAKQKKNRQDA